MTGIKMEYGSAGRRVADAVARLRIEQGLTLTELSRRTTEAGRRIPPVGLDRIFRYERRIDVDDLEILAQILHTTPANLMDATAADTYREDCLRWLLAEAEYRKANS